MDESEYAPRPRNGPTRKEKRESRQRPRKARHAVNLGMVVERVGFNPYPDLEETATTGYLDQTNTGDDDA